MKIISTDKQKDNLAKVFWDMGKIIFAVLVITPLARPEVLSVGSFVAGLIVGGFSWVLGYLIDGKEVQE
jgi:hypothetical protein